MISPSARLLDLEAAVDAAGFRSFVLVVTNSGSAAAVSYAFTYPETVSHLIMVNPLTLTRDLGGISPVRRLASGLKSLASEEWEMVTLAMANSLNESADRAAVRKAAETYRDGMTPAAFVAYMDESERIDLGPMLTSIKVPSLVIYDMSQGAPRAKEIAQRLAPRIPGARFVETDNPARAIREFVGEPAVTREPKIPSGTAIILFADIVDSTGLTERLGDNAFRQKARGLDEAMRKCIRDNGGTAVEGKTLGDGVLAVFTSAKQAIACAQACHDAASAAGLALHAGIHAGDVIREADNVYGGAVNIAARVAAASAAGETLVSATVRELARTSAGVVFEDRGEQALKGIDDPVRVWAVRQDGR